MRSGHVNLSLGFLREAGADGRAWSAIAHTTPAARYLFFDASELYSSYGPNSRWSGLPVRCLASGT